MINNVLVIGFLSLPLFFVRWFRWLAIVQQKEYRLDRIFLFIQSPEGQGELFYFPTFHDLHRSRLKRPVLTPRIIFVGCISIIILIISFQSILFGPSSHLDVVILLVILYLLIPIFIFFSVAVTNLPKELITLMFIKIARQKVTKNQPLIIGITGSYGKSSTRMILVQLLLNKYKVFTPPKSFNTRYSIAKYIMRYYQNEEVVILEYGAYRKGEIKELTSYFPPKFAVITGITKQHVGLFGSMENLVTAKSELIQALPEDGIVFANGDDSTVLKMVKDANKKVIYFSFNEPRCPIKKPRLKRYGQIEFNFGGKIISTRIVGKHYLTNILGAITVAKYLGIKDNDISEALNTFVPNELFVQIRHHQSGASIIDDSGTSNPKGFEASLAIVKHLKKTTNILIFSGIVDLGNDSSELHSKLAKQAGKVFQKVLYTGKEGVVEFRDIFEQELSTSEVEINDVLNNADKNTVILIEGRIPIHLYKRLKGEINGSAI